MEKINKISSFALKELTDFEFPKLAKRSQIHESILICLKSGLDSVHFVHNFHHKNTLNLVHLPILVDFLL